MQHKIGEQGLYTGNSDCGHRRIARYQQEVTQEVDVQSWNHQELPFSTPNESDGTARTDNLVFACERDAPADDFVPAAACLCLYNQYTCFVYRPKRFIFIVPHDFLISKDGRKCLLVFYDFDR